MESILRDVKNNPRIWLTQIFGILIVVANVWIAYKLSPLIQSLDKLSTRVTAVESVTSKVDPLILDYTAHKAEDKTIAEDLKTIKDDIKLIYRTVGGK